jgi:uncharacterized protein YbaR (Trm112 family)
MAVNADVTELLELLACPACRNAVVANVARVECTVCRRAFGLDGNVPLMGLRDTSQARSARPSQACQTGH